MKSRLIAVVFFHSLLDIALSLSTLDSEKAFLNFSTKNIGWWFVYMKLQVNNFFGLNYRYHEQLVEQKNELINITSKYDITDTECQDIIKHDVAIVNVQFATNRYTKTILDKRFTFADRLSSFGKKYTALWEENGGLMDYT